MNATAGANGMSIKMRSETTMIMTSDAASKRRDKTLLCASRNGRISFLIRNRRT